MDADADHEIYRSTFRSWLAERYPVRDPDVDDDRLDTIGRTPFGHDHAVQAGRRLQAQLADGGYSGVHLPVEYGGQGLTPRHVSIISEVLLDHETPSLRSLGIGMSLAMSTLLNSGTEAQRLRYLPPLVRAEEQWCQLFSEPDAGSDLVALRTRAIRDGDEWVLNGQKVWSSYAADAHFGLLLAVTSPDAERPQLGITMFIVAMDAPGVTVRPLVDIAGGQHFNEVFLEDVRVPADAVLGAVDGGWGVSKGTLGTERSGYMGGSGNGRRRRQLIAAARSANKLEQPVVRQRMMQIVSAECVLEWVRDRYVQGALLGGNPVAGSMMKLAAGTLEQRNAELISDIVGPAGIAWRADDRDGDRFSHDLNASRQGRIAGGTHQIQRNLLGERVLGLPREPS